MALGVWRIQSYLRLLGHYHFLRFSRNQRAIALIALVLSIGIFIETVRENRLSLAAGKRRVADVSSFNWVTPTLTPSPTPTPTPTPFPLPIPLPSTVPAQNVNPAKPSEWGVAKQIDEKTWTIKVGQDNRMTTAKEAFEALNRYRQNQGVGALSWDDNLAAFAQSRSDSFAQRHDIDGHAGFTDYINNQDGFVRLGFNHLGENSSYGYTVLGVHLIEWVYAGDEPHNRNQLRPDWTHVGIGISGVATDLVFGGR